MRWRLKNRASDATDSAAVPAFINHRDVYAQPAQFIGEPSVVQQYGREVDTSLPDQVQAVVAT